MYYKIYICITYAGVYKKQEFGRAGGGEINSYFEFLGKINSLFPLNKSKNRDFII